MKAPKPTQLTTLVYIRNNKIVETLERNKPWPLMQYIKKQKLMTGNYNLGELKIINMAPTLNNTLGNDITRTTPDGYSMHGVKQLSNDEIERAKMFKDYKEYKLYWLSSKGSILIQDMDKEYLLNIIEYILFNYDEHKYDVYKDIIKIELNKRPIICYDYLEPTAWYESYNTQDGSIASALKAQADQYIYKIHSNDNF